MSAPQLGGYILPRTKNLPCGPPWKPGAGSLTLGPGETSEYLFPPRRKSLLRNSSRAKQPRGPEEGPTPWHPNFPGPSFRPPVTAWPLGWPQGSLVLVGRPPRVTPNGFYPPTQVPGRFLITSPPPPKVSREPLGEPGPPQAAANKPPTPCSTGMGPAVPLEFPLARGTGNPAAWNQNPLGEFPTLGGSPTGNPAPWAKEIPLGDPSGPRPNPWCPKKCPPAPKGNQLGPGLSLP